MGGLKNIKLKFLVILLQSHLSSLSVSFCHPDLTPQPQELADFHTKKEL